MMWVKQCQQPFPSHHFYRWYAYHSQSWDIFFTHILAYFYNMGVPRKNIILLGFCSINHPCLVYPPFKKAPHMPFSIMRTSLDPRSAATPHEVSRSDPPVAWDHGGLS